MDVKNDYVQTHVALHGSLDPATLQTAYDALAEQARAALVTEGFTEEAHVFQRTADVRYFGQAFEVRVPVPEGPIDRGVLDEVARRFHAEHRALYGYDFSADASQQVEWVNLRTSGIGPIQRPEIMRHETADRTTSRGGPTRPVCFHADDEYVDTPVLWRPDLPPGHSVAGPVIIEEFGSTVPVHPGFTARIDGFLNIIVTRDEKDDQA